MTRVLVATESVHTTAAACDYLGSRLGPDDEVLLLTVETGELEARDAGDAANVARTRLVEPAVDTLTREGEPAAVIREVAAAEGVDEILLGQHRGDPDVAGDPPGSTVRSVLAEVAIPVVVVPI
jgi:nucleotide-binding universal stress UspA family protein